MHHIVTDAWSMSVFFDELGQHYEASVTGRPAALPDLRLQYGDFARWQQESLRGPMLDTKIDYWRGQLAGVESVLELPTDRPRPVARTPHGAVEHAVFPLALRDRLKARGPRCQRHALHDAAGGVCGPARAVLRAR